MSLIWKKIRTNKKTGYSIYNLYKHPKVKLVKLGLEKIYFEKGIKKSAKYIIKKYSKY